MKVPMKLAVTLMVVVAFLVGLALSPHLAQSQQKPAPGGTLTPVDEDPFTGGTAADAKRKEAIWKCVLDHLDKAHSDKSATLLQLACTVTVK